MKKIYIISSICFALMIVSCGKRVSHDHAEVEHVHGEDCAGHNHDHNHNHEKDKHIHGEECSGHDHDHSGHNHSNGSENDHSDEIIFPVEQAKAAGVKTGIIYPKSFNQVISVTGQVLSAQGDEKIAVANVAGIVSFKTSVTNGIRVNKDASLLVLSSQNLLEGDPASRAHVAYETAKREYERARELVQDQIISERDFNAIKQEYLNAQISYEAIGKNQSANGQIIVSPMTGYIKKVYVNEGDYVEVGQPLFSVTQNQRLYLRAEVSEKYYKYLPKIVSANFKTPYDDRVYKLSELKGKVLSFGKSADTSSFYVPVTFEFNNTGDIIEGSYVSVYLLSDLMENVIVLPKTALTEEQGLFFVYLQLDEEGYKKQPVKLGVDNGAEIQIVSGVVSGDRVVTEGAYHVKLASAVNALPAHSHEH